MKNNPIKKTSAATTGRDILKLFREKEKQFSGQTITSPVGDTEIILFGFWKNLLHHESFGVNNDFFQAGGNSLKGVQLVARICSHFSIRFDLTDLFLNPTITQIASLISGRQQEEPPSPAISKQPRFGHIPLSFSQERLWFISHLEDSPQYHLPVVFRLKGNLNTAVLNKVFQDVINRHEVLRTVFRQENDKVYQFILEKDSWNLDIQDGSKYLETTDNQELQAYIEKLIVIPFDLAKDHMVRATLLAMGCEDYLLVITMHHIASDAWSMSIIVNEVVELYSAYLEDRASNLVPLNLQYADYSIWQRNYLQDEILNNRLEYWKAKLDGVATLVLPADYARPSFKTQGEHPSISVSTRNYQPK